MPIPVDSFDLETHLARRAEFAPRIVCGVTAHAELDGAALHVSPEQPQIGLREDIIERFLQLVRGHGLIVNQFLPFDVGCVLEALSEEGPCISGRFGSCNAAVREIWEALRAGRFIGVDICQMLLDVAAGRLDQREKFGYGIVNLKRWNGIPSEDKEETWRLYFNQLDGIAPWLWPEDAKRYVLDDGADPLHILQRQLIENQRWIESYGHPVLHQAPEQTWHQICLHLVAGHGVRANAGRVERLGRRVEKEIDGYKRALRHRQGCDGDAVCTGCLEAVARVGDRVVPLPSGADQPLVRPDGSRDTKAAHARMRAVCEALGRPVPMTAPSAKFPNGQVQVDEDACTLSGDPVLVAYADFTGASVLRSRVDDLRGGTAGLPLNTEFTSIRATGRTSSRKPRDPHLGTQQQNWPRVVGARESLEPREGYAFLWGDFEAAEMHTLAQNCLDEVGYSRLGELLNQHIDPHAFFGGLAFEGGLTPEQVLALPNAKKIRDKAKPVNFGKPGGMGNEKWVLFARKQYNQLFTIEEADYYGKLWFQFFPEVKDLHKVVKRLLGRHETCTVRLKRGGFVAGGKRFPAACNFFFQAPCAAGAKAALAHVMFECYADPNSALFGCRVWNMVHDEICLECPIERVHEAGARLREIMEREFNRFTPDYPTGVEVIAGDAWSKTAKPVYRNSRGEKCKASEPDARLNLWHYEEKLDEAA